MRKVLIKGDGVLAIAAVAIFALFFVWVGLSIPSFAPLWFALLFLTVPALIILTAVAKGSTLSSGNRRVSSLFSTAEVSEKSVTLPEELDYEVGRLALDGYWMGSGRNRSYHIRRNFQVIKRSSGTFVEFPSEPFRVQVFRDGTGRVEAPAVRIASEPYKDVLLIFLTDEGTVEGNGSITLTKGSDVATVTFRGDGRLLTGTVQAELSRARKVRVEVGSGKVWKRIAEGQNFDFTFSPLPEEKTLIFAHYKTISPLTLVKSLWKDSVVLGHGNFELKAVLDIPLGKDVVERTTFRVELKGEESRGKEFEEEWGFWD